MIHPHTARAIALVIGCVMATLRRVGEPGAETPVWRSLLARTRKAKGLSIKPAAHLRVIKALSHPAVRPVVAAAPHIMFKYLNNYLKAGLSPSERATVLANHYTFLAARTDEHLFRKIVDGHLELWTHNVDGCTYSIRLTFPRGTHHEGDLALVFCVDGFVLYTLSCTIGPGGIAGLSAEHAIYVPRLQGRAGELTAIREAGKRCAEVSPSAMLLSAAEGVAMALGLTDMIGISGRAQLSAGHHSEPEGLVTKYDEFWMSVGGCPLDHDMYRLTVPFTEKPIQSIQRSHRSRAVRKRNFRNAIRDDVCAAFRVAAISTERS